MKAPDLIPVGTEVVAGDFMQSGILYEPGHGRWLEDCDGSPSEARRRREEGSGSAKRDPRQSPRHPMKSHRPTLAELAAIPGVSKDFLQANAGMFAQPQPRPTPQFEARNPTGTAGDRFTRKLEREIQSDIVTWLRQHSPISPKPVVIWHATHKASTATVGTPDIIVALPHGRTAWIEVKRPGQKPDKDQLQMHNDLRALGAAVFVCVSLDEARVAVASCSGKPPEKKF